MEVDSDEDHDLEEVNVGATSPVAEKQQQLDAEAQAEEEARRRDLDEALSDPSFNLELSSPTATSPTALAFGEATAARERSTSPLSPSPSPGGVFNAFYVPPAPRTVGVYLDAPGENVEQAAPVEQDMEGGYQETPAQSITPPPASPLQVHLQMPMSPILEIPPPRLSTVPVWALRSMDMMVGGSMGRGTPVDKDRKMEWVTVKPRYSTPMSPAISSAGGLFPVTGDVKKEHGDGGEERDRKPVLRLSMPGEDGNMSSGARGDSGRAIPNSSSGTGEKVGGGDAPFEPNDADWAAFLADLAAGGAQSSSASSIPGPSSGSQGYSQQEYQGHPPPYTPSSSTTLTLPGQHQQQHQQHPAFGMNVNMNLTNMFNMSNGVSGSPTTMMNFMPMHNMGNNLMNMGGMGNMSMPPLASPMPIGVNTPLSSPTHQVPPSMSPPHPSSAPPTPPPTSLVNVPMNMFGMGFGGNVQIGGASLQLGLTVSLTPGVGNNVNNSWFGSPPSSPPALNIGPDGSLIQDQQGQNHVQGSSSGSYSSPSTPTHEFDSNAMFGMGQMQGGMSTSMGVMSYGHPMNMGVAMGMGNGMGGGVAMGIRDGMSGMGGHSHPASPSGNGEVPDGSGSAQASPAQTSTASTLSYALG
ncbi:hypothetical protein BKA70DRAFT_1310140 [Coprinopsis sp. MPI-PUGE-AT-0042]|nr:hypothetical protein BKA70DRAFT_1310140 [Coprinopsis sp. MPI-PUGE-AT-0042]